MPETSQEEDKTYIKSIDDLIEDAEIEAEIETEKKIRSKNTRILTISLIAIALIAFIFLQVKTSSKATSPVTEEGGPLPELASVPVPDPTTDSQSPDNPETPASTDESMPTGKPAEVEANPPAMKQETVDPVEKTDVQASVPAPTVEKPVIDQTPLKAPAPPPAETPKLESGEKQPAAPTPVQASSAKQYHVQLGVFSVADNARRFEKNLKAKGLKPSVQSRSIQAVRHVVYVGGFSSKNDGAKAMADLKSRGFAPVMERFEDNSHTIILGKLKDAGQAETLRDKLSINGFLSSSKKSTVQTAIHIVQLGPFKTLPQAQKAQKSVDRAGFNNSFIR